MYFNKVSSYLHHIGPRLSCYSVHNICSCGNGVKPHPMRSRYSYTETDGQCTAHPALSMVTAPPTSLTAKCNRVSWCPRTDSNRHARALASKTSVSTNFTTRAYILKHTKGNAILLSQYVGCCLMCFNMETHRGVEPLLPG